MAGRATEPVSTLPTLLNCCCNTVDLEWHEKELSFESPEVQVNDPVCNNVVVSSAATLERSAEERSYAVNKSLPGGDLGMLDTPWMDRSLGIPLVKLVCVKYRKLFSGNTHTLTFWVTQSLLAWLTLHLPPSQSGLCSFSVKREKCGDTLDYIKFSFKGFIFSFVLK